MATQMTTGDDITEQNASAAAVVVRWSEIPYDVLGMIRARVGSPRGRVFFTSVCRSWRAAACLHPSPPAMPLLLLSSWYGMSHRYDNPTKMKSLYCLEDGEVMRVFPPRDIWSNWHVGGTDDGWIALWQSNEEPLNAVVITNLFSGTEVTLSEKQRTLVCKVCSPKGFLIRKIAFSEAPTSSSCILAAMTNTCRVAVCKVGCPDYGWTTHGCRERELHDIAFCQGELYGVTCYGEKLFKYDIGVDSDGAPAITAVHLLVAQTYASPTRWSIHDESVVYLIELRCKLVMAVRSRLLPPERKTSFNLFELVKDAEGYRWVEMRSLDEYALFLGPKCSRAVHVPVGGRRGVERLLEIKQQGWLAVHQRCLTADNLQSRGWPNAGSCQLCLTEPETCTHLFVRCSFSRQVWLRIKQWTAFDFPEPDSSFASTEDWWALGRKRVPKALRRDFDTIVILVHWKIWKERNSRIFDHVQHSTEEVFKGIRDEISLWQAAGCVVDF